MPSPSPMVTRGSPIAASRQERERPTAMRADRQAHATLRQASPGDPKGRIPSPPKA